MKSFSNLSMLGKTCTISGLAILLSGTIVFAAYYNNDSQAGLIVDESSIPEEISSIQNIISSEEVSSDEISSQEVSSEVASSKPPASSAVSSKPPAISKPPASSKPAVSSSSPASSKPVNSSNPTLSKLETLNKTNPDVKGMLRIPGTNVNYPIAQTTNNTYYLDHNEYKKSSVWGVPYADFRTELSSGSTSKNIMLYGHGDDKRGLMLSNMKKYRDVNFYKKTPVIEFDTLYEKAKYKVVAFFIEDVSPSREPNVFHFWDYIDDPSGSGVDEYIQNAKQRSYFSTNVDVLPSDQLLSIQVCRTTNISDYNRLVLVARKVRPGESESVDTSAAQQLISTW